MRSSPQAPRSSCAHPTSSSRATFLPSSFFVRLILLGLFAWANLLVGASRAHAEDPPKATDPATPAAVDPPKTDPPAASSGGEEKVDETGKRLEAVEGAAAEGVSAAHNTWVLVCSAMVLFMTAPGLAMFYSGLVRRKNVLGVMMQCVFLMGLMTVLWALYGYSLCFGGSNPYYGDGQFLFMNNVARTWNEPFVDKNGNAKWDDGEEYTDLDANAAYSTGAVTPVEGKLYRLTHMLFQGMFFIITPALICGAFAERMKFSTMVVFMTLWGTLVYCPLCHWVWDYGILSYEATGFKLGGGALDFAGGTVVHISSGISALVCALVIGKRHGYGIEPMPPHNLTYTTLGAAMLWFGWFGFNAGSRLMADGLAASAFATTHFSAAAGALAWAGMEWYLRKKPSVLGTCSGAVAGLVCITPAAGFVQPMPAIIMGLAAGVVCFLACTSLKSAFKYDDSLDAFGVHGVGGTLGAILTGVFATRACYVIGEGEPLGLIEGETKLFIGQIVVALFAWVYSAVVTVILLKILDVTMGLRVNRDAELQGLDLSQHGEEGYIQL